MVNSSTTIIYLRRIQSSLKHRRLKRPAARQSWSQAAPTVIIIIIIKSSAKWVVYGSIILPLAELAPKYLRVLRLQQSGPTTTPPTFLARKGANGEVGP